MASSSATPARSPQPRSSSRDKRRQPICAVQYRPWNGGPGLGPAPSFVWSVGALFTPFPISENSRRSTWREASVWKCKKSCQPGDPGGGWRDEGPHTGNVGGGKGSPPHIDSLGSHGRADGAVEPGGSRRAGRSAMRWSAPRSGHKAPRCPGAPRNRVGSTYLLKRHPAPADRSRTQFSPGGKAASAQPSPTDRIGERESTDVMFDANSTVTRRAEG